MTDDRAHIATTCDRIAQRMGGRFVLNEDRPMNDKQEPVAVCSHGIRHPWACHDCDNAAWNTRTTPQPDASALVEAIVEAALDVANVVSHDGYYEIDRDAAVRAALSAWEAQHG